MTDKTSVELYLQALIAAERRTNETFLHEPGRVVDEFNTQEERDRARDDAEQANWLRVGVLAMRRWIEIEEHKRLRYDPKTECHHDFATLPLSDGSIPCRNGCGKRAVQVPNGLVVKD